MQDDQSVRDLPQWEDTEGVASRGPLDGGFPDGGRGDRGLKPIPEDSMRPSMDVRNGSELVSNEEVSPLLDNLDRLGISLQVSCDLDIMKCSP